MTFITFISNSQLSKQQAYYFIFHCIFPDGVNVHFIQQMSISVRVLFVQGKIYIVVLLQTISVTIDLSYDGGGVKKSEVQMFLSCYMFGITG